MAYTPYGPWTDAVPPGVSAEFLNPLETFLQTINSAATDSNISANGVGVMTLLGLIANGAIQPNPTSTVLTGATSGTATLWQPFTGTFKLVFVYQNGFRNASGSAQNLAFPVPFTTQAWIMVGDANTFSLLLSGATQNLRQMQNLGSMSTVTQIGTGTFASVGACDTIAFSGGQASVHTGPIVFLGI